MFFPPARGHDQHAQGQSTCKSCQHYQNQRCFPDRTKKEIDGRFILVVQRKCEKRKKKWLLLAATSGISLGLSPGVPEFIVASAC